MTPGTDLSSFVPATGIPTSQPAGQSGGSGFFATLGYDIQQGWYDVTGLGTPPVVMPVDSTPALQAQVQAIPSVFNMAGSAVSQTSQQIVNALPAVTQVVTVTVIGLAAYIMYQLLKVKKATQ